MIIFWYKLSQQYYPTIYIQRLENTYEKLNNLNEDLIWYNKAKQEADNKFLPEKHSKWIKRFNDKWINIIFLIFFFIIIINQTFPNLIIDLSIFWKSGILILIQYSLYRVYLDWNYIYPNIKYFQETSPLFYPDNDGLPKINWRKHIFEGGTKLRGVGQACLYCCIMCAGICWVGKEFFPKNQSICEQTGNYIQNNEFFKKKIERILPPNKENE